jgi:hypothetical protein
MPAPDRQADRNKDAEVFWSNRTKRTWRVTGFLNVAHLLNPRRADMKRFSVFLILAVLTMGLITAVLAAEPDPAGTKTGVAADVIAASTNAPHGEAFSTGESIGHARADKRQA